MVVDTLPTRAELSDDALDAFAAELRGPLIRPADAEYDAARAVWNGMIDRYPVGIARCAGVADVVAAVTFAREHDLPLAVRGGGHNVAGNAVCDGGLVLDLSAMRGVYVDPAARTARVQGGATWGDVDRETQHFGLATPGGGVSTTGVAGLTLGGGFGRLRRKYGLTIDNLLSVQIVTADGRALTASATEHPDLFWAVRGGGGNFGVVTSFEFRLHPLGPEVFLLATVYALGDAPAVLGALRDFMADAPEEISVAAALGFDASVLPPLAHLGDAPILVVDGLYAGAAAEGARLMQPLRELATPLLDLSGPATYVHVQSAMDALVPAGARYYWKARDVDDLGDELIAELCERCLNRPSPRSIIEVWHNGGGAIGRVGVDETAYGGRDAPFFLTFAAGWSEPADDEANIAWARAGWAAIERYSSGGMYVNFPGFGEEREALVGTVYGPNLARLAQVKARYDPDNLFRMNQNITPAMGRSTRP